MRGRARRCGWPAAGWRGVHWCRRGPPRAGRTGRARGCSWSRSSVRVAGRPGRAGQFLADRFQLPELVMAEARGHGAGHVAGVLAADVLLHVPACGGQRQPDAAPAGGGALARDRAGVGEPVHQAGQSRLAEQDMPVEFADPYRIKALRQGVEDVVLAQGQLRPDVLRGELLEQRGVRGQQRFPRFVGEVAAGHHRSGYSAWYFGSVSAYGDAPVTLSPRLAFGRGWRAGWSPYLARTRLAWVGASGVGGSWRAAISLRSTGTTSPPSSSSWSSTVLSGRPAWSIRNSWRW